MIGQLEAGDVLMVTRLDRLARSTRDLLNTLAAIADRKAGFRSLANTWADTTTPHGRLMLTVLGGLAEFERDLIRARTSEGRARAVARGVRLGRKPKLTDHQKRDPWAEGPRGRLVWGCWLSRLVFDAALAVFVILGIGSLSTGWRRSTTASREAATACG